MKLIIMTTVVVLACMAEAQRPPYAGRRPIGYPELGNRFQSEDDATSSTTTSAGLANRLGEDGQPLPTTTTDRLPVDALGDRELVNRISKWPVDKQPYWYINWKQIEAHRQNPVVTPNFNPRPSFVRQPVSASANPDTTDNTGANTNPNTNGNTGVNTNPNTNGNTGVNTNPNTNGNTGANTNPNTNRNINGRNTNRNTNINTNANNRF